MRVITGKAKGRKLKAVKGLNTRPTTDRVKESLFSIIGHRVGGARFLDLFSGTGSIGIEALSRGASVSVFVEKDKRALSVIRDNLTATGLLESAKVLPLDSGRALRLLGDDGQSFDLVFMDPPYRLDIVPEILQELDALDLISQEGWVICEQHKETVLPPAVGRLELFRQEAYGDTQILFYRRGELLSSSQA